jgi:hypothetical protein
MAPADKLKQEALDQIEAIEKKFSALRAKGGTSVYENGAEGYERAEFNSMCLGAIERIAGTRHAYSEQARTTIQQRHGIESSAVISPLYGIVCALKADVASGRLASLAELEHASLFGDLMEAGEYLLESGYKNAAAVQIGSILESHLRLLSTKNSLPIDAPDAKTGKMVPLKADVLNAALAKAGVYSKGDQKNATGWLDLRNSAAHGKYGDYTKEKVELFAAGIRLFMQQYPA